MTRGFERLSDHQRDELFGALEEGDPTGEGAAAILGKELLGEVYAAPTARRAHWRLMRFYGYAAEAEVPELTRLATTISSSEQEVLSSHTSGISTGTVEAQNLVTEKIRRIGHGFRNFENSRLRLCSIQGFNWTLARLHKSGDALHAWSRRATET